MKFLETHLFFNKIYNVIQISEGTTEICTNDPVQFFPAKKSQSRTKRTRPRHVTWSMYNVLLDNFIPVMSLCVLRKHQRNNEWGFCTLRKGGDIMGVVWQVIFLGFSAKFQRIFMDDYRCSCQHASLFRPYFVLQQNRKVCFYASKLYVQMHLRYSRNKRVRAHIKFK
jgi:hypothetical protein